MSTLTLNEMQQLIKKHGGDECVRKFLAEETVVAPVHGTVYVDRTICPTYPQWVDKVLYPELESTGPAEFDAGKLELWLHNGQKTGCVTGKTIHQYLQDHDMLKNSLGLRDLEEIQKKGLTFFRKHFKGKYVFGWKAVVRYRIDYLSVPALCGDGGQVYLYWCWLDDVWRAPYPALLLASA